MAKKKTVESDESRLTKAFDVLVDIEAEEALQMDAIQTVMEMKVKNASLLRKVLLEQPTERQEAIADALRFLSEAEGEGEECMGDDMDAFEEDEDEKAEEDAPVDMREFTPTGELCDQLAYAFRFMGEDRDNFTAAQEQAVKFLRQHRKRRPREFFVALNALDDVSRALAMKLFKIGE